MKTIIKLAGIPVEIHALYMLPSSIGDYETEELQSAAVYRKIAMWEE